MPGLGGFSRWLFIANPLDHEVGRQVDDERHQEQHQADDEQHAIVGVAFHRLAQLGGDGGRQRADRIEQAVRDLDRVAGGHQHGHGFADRPAHPQEHGGQQSVLGGRKQHAIDDLPAAGAQRQGRLAVGIGHGLQGVLADRDDDRHAHQGQDDAAVQEIDADRAPVRRMMIGPITM